MLKKTTITKRKTATALIALTLISIIAVPLFAANAAVTFHTYIVPAPSTVGVDQQATIVFGFTMPTRGIGYRMYSNWQVTITKPDNTVMTKGPYTSDSTGSTWMQFTPDKVGTWKIKAHYPGGYVDFADQMNVSVPAATTAEVTLTVQQESVPWVPDYFTSTPFPNQYWTFPIYGENREWHDIAGNWLMSGYDAGRHRSHGSAFNPYTTMPNASHILWTKPQLFGGIIGGESERTYYTGSNYRPQLQPPVIINGRLYYNKVEPPSHGFYCVDIATGETVWYKNATYPDASGKLLGGTSAHITLGQVFTFDSPNWHGGIPFLWSTGATTWGVWNAWTGDLYFTIINAPSIGTGAEGVTFFADQTTGAIITYRYYSATKNLVKWNSSRLFDKLVSANLDNFYNSGPKFNLDWKAGIEWNVTLPANIPTLTSIDRWIRDPKDFSIIIATNQTRGTLEDTTAFMDVALSGVDGRVLWSKVRNEGTWEAISGGSAMSVKEGIYVLCRKETRQVYAFDVQTGNQVWVSEPRPNNWATFTAGPFFAYGKLYVSAYDGELWAHDAKTGNLVWKWGPVDSGLETVYGHYPFFGALAIADNKIAIANTEHTVGSPIYRGTRMYVIDATSGETVWSIGGWYQWPIAANSLLLAPNGYDAQIYTFGKGPSAITVDAPMAAISEGSSLVIRGRITDISAGTEQEAVAKRFPQGVPAVSDDSMSAWMEYIYMQKPRPSNATGVNITLSVVDANNNYRDIGTTTSDADGFYSLQWRPDIPGKYTLYATFAGSQSYWSSQAVTAFAVDPATAPTQPTTTPTQTPTQTATTTPTTSPQVAPGGPAISTEAMIAIIAVVIVVVAIAAATLFRRKK